MFPFTTRVQSIFPTGGGGSNTPFPTGDETTPNMAAGGVNPQFFQQMVGMIQNERNQQRNQVESDRARSMQEMQKQRQFAEATEKAGPPPSYKTEYAPSPTFQGMTPEKEKELNLKQQSIAAQYGYKGAQLAQGQEKIDLNRQLGQEKIGVSQQRADAYSLRQKYMGSQIKADEDGKLWVIHPDGTTEDPGINVSSQEDLLNLKHDNAIDEITTRGGIQKDIQKMRNDAAAAKNTDKPTSGYSTQQLNMARAQEFLNANPDMRHVVSVDPTNHMITINPPNAGGLFSNAITNDQRQKAYDWIYKGNGSAISNTTGGNKAASAPASSTTTPNAPKAPDGRTNIFKDGKFAGHVPNAQVDDAKKQGYTTGGGEPEPEPDSSQDDE